MNVKKAIVDQLGNLIDVLHLRNYIVLEIEPGRADNTEPLCRKMIENKWTEKYHIAVLSYHPDELKYLERKNVSVIKRADSNKEVVSRIKCFYARARAALIADVTYSIGKISPKSIRVYLTHGSPMKSVQRFLAVPKDTDYMLNQSDFWTRINSKEFSIDPQKLITLGYPRNDELFRDQVDLRKLFIGDYKKYVIWYPTFRHHVNSSYREGVAIPVIHNIDYLLRINEIAAAYNVLILIKPHPYQDVKTIGDLQLSNVKIIYDSIFIENQISAYAFLGQTDALITDYSSVVFDYLITGKPIALTFEDYDLYSQHNGFAIDTDILKSCAEMLNAPEDFERFFSDLVNGRDPFKKQRMSVMHLTNKYTDANSSERVVDWIESLLKA